MKNRYSKYKPSGVEWIGDIPDHWIVNKLKILTLDHRQGYYSSKDYDERGYKVVRITDINDDNTLTIENSPYYDIEHIEYERFGLKYGDFLFPRTGGVGRFGIYHETIPSIYGSFLIRFRFSNTLVHSFIKYYLNSQSYLNQILQEIHGGVNQNVHVENIKECKVTFPIEKIEQEQIVKYLDEQTGEIDNLISITEKKIELLKENRTSTINRVITKGLDPNVELKDSGIDWIGEIPKHWVVSKLSYITDKIGDGIHSTPEYVDSSEYSFVNGNNLNNGFIEIKEETKKVSEDEYNKYKLELTENTILLSINGTIGNLSFFRGEKVVFGKSVCYIVLKDNKINRNFGFYLLLSNSIKEYFTFELTGTTIYNLSLRSIRNTPIPFPDLVEQEQIVKYLDQQTQEIDTLVSIEQQRIETLKEYRQSLISEVITGKVRVCEEVKL